MLYARQSARQQLGYMYSGGLRRRLGATTCINTSRAAVAARVVTVASSSSIATTSSSHSAGYARNDAAQNGTLPAKLCIASSWCRPAACATSRSSRPAARLCSTTMSPPPKTATGTSAAASTAIAAAHHHVIRSFSTDGDDAFIYETQHRHLQRSLCGIIIPPQSTSTASILLLHAHHGPQSTLPRLDLHDDPSLAKLSPVQIARKIVAVPVGRLNTADVAHGLISIIKDCCKVQTEEGMDAARGLLRRCLDERRHVNAALLRELEQRAVDRASGGGDYIIGDDDDDDDSIDAGGGWCEPLIITQLPFHILAHGWARMCGRGSYRDGPDKVSDVMDWMAREDEYDRHIWDSLEQLLPHRQQGEDSDQRMHSSNNKDSCQPTTASYNTLLTAYVYASKQNRRAGRAAEDVLKQMTQLNKERGWHTKPNTKSYGLAISAHAKSDRYKSARFAEYVLNDMKARHEADRERYEDEVGRPYDVHHPSNNAWKIVTPDVIAYTNVISAYANADAKGYAQRAEEILFDMMDNRDRFGIRPDSQAFAAAIRAWANAARRMGNPKARFEAAERAEGLLTLMEELAVEEQQMAAAANDGEGVVGNGNASGFKKETVDEWDEKEQDTLGVDRSSCSHN